MAALIGRRKFAGMILGALAAAALGRPLVSQAGATSPTEVCLWQRTGQTLCQGGQLYEQWTFSCCIPGHCDNLSSEWRPTGTPC